jgi:predicted cupin superfamily sugar epimerase
MDNPAGDEIIKFLNLKPLAIEGGYFKETYRSGRQLQNQSELDNKLMQKSLCSAIFFLLTQDTFSCLHKLPYDEIYHFYLGDPVNLLLLFPDGTSDIKILGHDILKGQQVKQVVPGGTWQGSRLCAHGRFALMGTTMAPAFDYSDYVAGERDALIKTYPQKEQWIKKLTNP